MSRQGNRGRDKKDSIYDPGSVLSGEALRRAASAATRLEYNPVISAHLRELQGIARQRRRDDRGLIRLGNQTGRAIDESYGRTNRSLADASQQMTTLGRGLENDTAAMLNKSNERTNALQSGVMGEQMNSLAARGIEPGNSGSQDALAKAVAARQADATVNQQALGSMAQAASKGMQETAQNRLASSQMMQAGAKTAANSAIMSRRANSRAAYGDAQREVGGSLRNARSLKGATMLSNLMKLRESERGFVNERAALMQDSQQARMENQLGYAKLEDDNNGGGSGGSGGSGDGPPEPEDYPNRLLPSFWREWLRATERVRGDTPIKKGYWDNLFNKVDDEIDGDWTEVQRKKFQQRYIQWYKNNVLNS